MNRFSRWPVHAVPNWTPPAVGHKTGNSFFVRCDQLWRFFMVAYYPRPEASPGLARWRDRVFRRKSTSGASATGPESQRARRAAESQSRRATERARARQASPPRPLQLRWQFQTHPQFRCPAAGALCLSPSLVAHSHTHLVIRSGKSHRFGRSKCSPPGRGRGAADLARSAHPTTTGDPAPPVLFSRPSQLATVWC